MLIELSFKIEYFSEPIDYNPPGVQEEPGEADAFQVWCQEESKREEELEEIMEMQLEQTFDPDVPSTSTASACTSPPERQNPCKQQQIVEFLKVPENSKKPGKVKQSPVSKSRGKKLTSALKGQL